MYGVSSNNFQLTFRNIYLDIKYCHCIVFGRNEFCRVFSKSLIYEIVLKF